ncbi:NAD-dependent protein deacetylase [Pseudoxanthomonas sp. UTMC 1351]|uniref:NAD-dependent protein deacetylase n=1 Tax=Pseudoxanthomonas sp. UTMC 1351 TaxID=2695853 RepID=UPI0034CE045D
MDAPVRDSIHEPAAQLRAWLAAFERVFVLTGAGCSTASGIPDYRDTSGEWKRPPPVTYQAFVGDPAMRARYWARSLAGWPRVAEATPNAAHMALAQWKAAGRLSMLVTQNVDGLHQRAGSDAVIDLHGRLDEVVCLACSARQSRDDLQRQLQDANPEWAGMEATSAPDGDADLEGYDFSRFRVPDCRLCGGLLKPDVVFFGENVPRIRYETARAALENSDAVLVVGSSLMVYSGFRFVRLAHETGKPIALLNRGHTRADAMADLKLDADCVETLPRALIVQEALDIPIAANNP